jgi:serine/threonine kinase 38
MDNSRVTPTRKRDQKEDVVISSQTKEKAQAAKSYIEMRYSKIKKEESVKKSAWEELGQKMTELSLSNVEQELIKNQIFKKEAEVLRNKRRRVNIFDYEPLTLIGRGAFGEVRVVRHKQTSEIFALKKMNKAEMLKKNQTTHVRAERNVLALAKNDWIIDLKVSFQDEKYLYLVMEYLAGGDLMTMLIKRDILPELEARFYIAETILAVESVHKLNYIHRDLKPDNILIDNTGHVKLSDFGLCKQSDINFESPYSNLTKFEEEAKYKQLLDRKTEFKRSRKLAYSTVGTPDYIAPEVFARKGYDESVDWWSVGVILYEMVVGYPPFFADDPSTTCQKILHWKKTFVIPREANLSREVTDLIRKLVSDSGNRLGLHGAEEIKRHPFFNGVDWENIRKSRPPWVPELKGMDDTSNFDKFEETEPFYSSEVIAKKKRKDPNFPAYTYTKEDDANYYLLNAIKELDEIKGVYK